MGKRSGRRVFAGAFALGIVLAILVAVSGLMVPASQRAALGASITVTVISGSPSARVNGMEISVPDGAVLHAGDVIRTGADTRVVLTYFEGSTVSVEPGSELVIEEASFGDEGATVIKMTQTVGRTWHVVTKLIKNGSRYEVKTPVSTATVRGTAFEVAVDGVSGETTVTTTEGAVGTSDSAGTTEVVVTPGLETTVKANQPPAAPVPAAEPVRKVSVQLESTNSVVVDSLGRANGMRDGKVVLQTPGATIVQNEKGILVIMPNIPEGRLAVVERDSSAKGRTVNVTTQTKGAEPVHIETAVSRDTAGAEASKESGQDREASNGSKEEAKETKSSSGSLSAAAPSATLTRATEANAPRTKASESPTSTSSDKDKSEKSGITSSFPAGAPVRAAAKLEAETPVILGSKSTGADSVAASSVSTAKSEAKAVVQEAKAVVREVNAEVKVVAQEAKAVVEEAKAVVKEAKAVVEEAKAVAKEAKVEANEAKEAKEPARAEAKEQVKAEANEQAKAEAIAVREADRNENADKGKRRKDD